MNMKTLKLILFIVLFVPVSIFSQENCKITYIANEGFLVELSGKKVLFDAIFDKIEGDWCDSPSDSIVERIRNAKYPFNDVDIIAVSHGHQDHFDEEIMVAHLLNNSKAIVICPDDVGKILSKNPAYPKFNDRIISFTPELFCDSIINVLNIPIRVMRLEHSLNMVNDSLTGLKINKHKNVENLGFLFTINGFKIFHSGDTNPLNEEEYIKFSIQDEGIELAFLERMFYAYGKPGIDVIEKYIKPKKIILMHINPTNLNVYKEYFKDAKNIHFFQHKMDTIILKLED